MSGFSLRGYQREAIEAIRREWEKRRSTLLVAATGAGKTVMFSEVLRRRKEEGHGRALVVAHREELIEQAAEAMRRVGLTVEIEKAERRAAVHGFYQSDVVVASVQTLQGRRLKRWPDDHFGTVVADECHHAVARTWREVIGHFTAAKVLGVSATPDRADSVGLGGVFESVAYRYDMRDAIQDGYLVPLRVQSVECADLDLSDVKSTRGDLSESDLQKAMSIDKVLHQIAGPLLELSEGRQTIIFGPGVEWAHAFAEVLHGYLPEGERADALDGSTPKDERKRIIGDFREGRIRVLINMGVLTEGFDAPVAACVAMCRPTKSRALFTQIVGRGTRTLPGVIDGVEDPEERHARIAASAKPDCLVLDFRGNAGRHKLITPLDCLAGKPIPDDIRREAEKAAAEGKDLETALREAEERALERQRKAEAARMRAKVRADVAFRAEEVDPFAVDDAGPPATEAQIRALKNWGYEVDPSKPPSRSLASKHLDWCVRRKKKGRCTYAQAKTLIEKGVPREALRTMSASDASRLIDRIAANGWSLPPDVTFDTAEAAE